MNNRTMVYKKYVMALLFSTQVVINWIYILWVKSQPDIIINAWFVVLPMIGYFYFTFALIANIGIINGEKLGITLAYCVLMFGSAASIISYNIIYNRNPVIEQFIVPLIVINILMVFYLAWNRGYCNKD